MLRAMRHDIGHRTDRNAFGRLAVLQHVDDVLSAPTLEATMGLRAQIWRVPILLGDAPSRKRRVAVQTTPCATCRMALVAMSKSLHEIRAAIPCCGLRSIGLIDACFEVHCTPRCKRAAHVIGKAQFEARIRL